MSQPIHIHLPSSKSISNRLLMIRQLSGQDVEITHLSMASDTQLLIQLLEEVNHGNRQLNIKDAGTACRFMIAYCATREHDEFILQGSHRMHDRPQMDLIQALRNAGASIRCTDKEGFLPLKIIGAKLQSSQIVVNGNISSQFISALCMIAPGLPLGLQIHIQGEIVSEPYIHMTLKLMERMGIQSYVKKKVIEIPSQPYQMVATNVEADWSSAAFFYAALILKPSLHLFLSELQASGLQADEKIIAIAKDFGIKTIHHSNGCEIIQTEQKRIPTSIDFTNTPDLALPLMVVLAIKYPEITITGVQHLKHKESDRIEAIKTELFKANILLIEKKEGISFCNLMNEKNELHFDSHQDHRIVMALSLFQLIGKNPIFNETQCVEKSFPHYFREFQKVVNIN